MVIPPSKPRPEKRDRDRESRGRLSERLFSLEAAGGYAAR